MKIFIKNNKLNHIVKVIKEEKLYSDCWNVIIHTFDLRDQKVLYSLGAYKKISGAVKESLTQPEGYELYGKYYETPCDNLKYLQAKCIGVRVLISIVFPENIGRNEIIRTFASMKPSMNTIYALVQCRGWSFLPLEETFENYKIVTESPKKAEVKFDFESKKETTPRVNVDHILYDEEKRIVIVFFKDGTKIVKKCHSEDKFDIYVGVSLAITKYLFGNNTTNFIKFVNRKKKKIPTKKGGK